MALQTFTYPEIPENSITTKHQNEAYFFIDSVDKYSLIPNSSSYDLTTGKNQSNYLINHQKIYGYGEISKLALTEIQWAWTTPNVNIRNNIFFFAVYVSGTLTNYYVEIPEGFYLPSELAVALQTALNTTQYINYPSNTSAIPYGQPDWLVSVDSKTNAFTVSNSNSSIIWAPTPPVNAPSINTLMGFPAINFGSITSAGQLRNSWTGGIPSMQYTTYVDICSNALTRFEVVKDSLTQFSYTNIIARLYLSDGLNQPNIYFGSRPSVIYRQIQDPKWIKFNHNQQLNTGIDIQYYDDKGQLLYIPDTSLVGNNQIFTIKMCEY